MNKSILALGFSLFLVTGCNNNAVDDSRNMGTRNVDFTSDQSERYSTGHSQSLGATNVHPLVQLGKGDHQYHMDSSYRGSRNQGGTDLGTIPSPTDDYRYVELGRGGRSFGGAGKNGTTADLQSNSKSKGQSNRQQSKAQSTQPNGELLRINRGYITIDPNAYSTSTPSTKFPHTKYIKQGQWKFETIKQGQNQAQPAPQQPQTTQPNQTQNQKQPAQAPNQASPKTAPAAGISSVESRVIELTNAERKKAGLPALQADTKLSNVAREKSRDMQQKGYFSHTSPTYGSPFDMMRDFGITYQSAGENIAKGQRSAEEVVQAWMNSEGHRKNILSGNYSHIGVGYVESGNHWTQMFIKK